MAYKLVNNIKIENARIMFRNFSGKETKFNAKGRRNFCVLIDDPEVANQLAEEGWNIRILAPRDEGDEARHYIQVAVGFQHLPPKVTLVTKRAQTALDEESISSLDYAEIKNIDLTIRPRIWDDNGVDRIKAYLKTMWVTIEEDEFAEKYTRDEDPDEKPW